MKVIDINTHAHSLGDARPKVIDFEPFPNNDPFCGERKAYHDAAWARADEERRFYERGE